MGNVKKSTFGYSNFLAGVCIMIMASIQAVIGEPCVFSSDPCMCKTSTFEMNLTSLMDAMKGADFSATGEGGDYTYYVQPCNRPLSSQFAACNNVDQNLISCQVYRSATVAYGLGIMNKFDVTKVQDDFVLTNSYVSPFDYVTRQLHLTIKCATQNATFSYDGNSGPWSPSTYRFTLLTKYICGGGGSGGEGYSVTG